MEKLMNLKQVAELLNVSKQSIYKLAMLEKIPCVRINYRLLFDPKDIEEWIEDHKTKKNS